MRLHRPSSATLAALVVCVVWLFHTTAIDRLDISKLAMATALASIALGVSMWRREDVRGSYPVLGLVGLSLLLASVFFGSFVGARVEGWAPWVVAGVLFALVRQASSPRVGGVLSATAALLAAVGMAQALGLDWFVGDLAGFAGRPVMATLGNPDVFGVCLAGALPFALVRARRARFAVASAVILAAIVLSGSRTAWVMLLPSCVVGIRSLRPARLLALVAVGALVGVGFGLSSPHVDLGGRIADLGEKGGTAAGRVYLWRVHGQLVRDAGAVGSGPEGFRRAWPWAQADFLADHPDQIGFNSDLRHAHADVVEFLTDWGWVGLAIGLFWTLGLLWPSRLRRRSDDARDDGEGPTEADRLEQLAARGSVAALLLGGLATAVLFQPASLFFAAVVAGVLAPRRTVPVSPIWRICAIAGLVLTLFWVGQRTVSEVYRTDGLRAEVSGRPAEARASYRRAVAVDSQNPLALVMLARSLIAVDPTAAVDAASRATEHLPTPSVYAVRALAAEAAGRHALASESWAIVRRLFPEPSD